MTKKEALESLVQIEADSLLDKVLIDQVLTGTDTYTSADKDDIELASAYVFKFLATHPDFKEGGLTINIDRAKCTALANSIFTKFGYTNELMQGVTAKISFEQI